MSYDIILQLQFFGVSILCGGLVLLAYDGLRILRRLVNQSSLVLALEDIVFWIFAAIFIFAVIYKENNGIIRGFSLIGMTIGMLLYHWIISDYLVITITKLIKLLLRPIIVGIRMVKRLLHYLIARLKTFSEYLFRQLKRWTKTYKIALDTRKQNRSKQRRAKLERKLLKKQKQEVLARKQKK